jgi:hypothetical protein
MARLSLASLALIGLAPCFSVSAEVQPRSYSSLFAKSSVVAAGTVKSVSSGFMSDQRSAQIEVEGLFKGKLRSRILEVTWKDKEFQESGYKEDARVIVFAVMRKDSSFAQAAPGISCWPVEKVAINGKPVKAVAYSYPMDLVTGLPKGVFRETEVLEKSLNFQIPKRKKWIMTDALLPAMHPLRLAKPKKHH